MFCFLLSPGPQTLALPLLAPRDSFPVKAWNHFLFEVEVMSAHLTATSPLLLPMESELRKKLLPASSPRT